MLPVACLFVLPVHAADLSHPVTNTLKQRVESCAMCHGEQGQGGANGFYPRIGGKPAEYLYHQLLNFRDGRREYAPMEYMVRPLSDKYLHEIAEYFANKHPDFPDTHPPKLSDKAMARGKQLVSEGDPSKGIPACSSCHGKQLHGVEPGIPGLVGLPYEYISAQIGAWQTDTRAANKPDCMAKVAAKLSPADISAVSGWLASQTADASARPAPAGSVHTPMTCGSQEN
ncbi:c-type cytochrome [Oleiagrimonas sp. C23AA]|nr:c-type cytochrome [Oleiagrimonas sp. C23AA]